MTLVMMQQAYYSTPYHMNIEEKNSATAIRAAGTKIISFSCMWLRPGNAGNDISTGMRLPAALKEIKYDGGVVIESFTTDVKVIAKAASIWRDFEPSKDDIAVKGLSFLKEKSKLTKK
jgi:D-psicose/D-tagatose/L-ribulose 3-epimerase